MSRPELITSHIQLRRIVSLLQDENDIALDIKVISFHFHAINLQATHSSLIPRLHFPHPNLNSIIRLSHRRHFSSISSLHSQRSLYQSKYSKSNRFSIKIQISRYSTKIHFCLFKETFLSSLSIYSTSPQTL